MIYLNPFLIRYKVILIISIGIVIWSCKGQNTLNPTHSKIGELGRIGEKVGSIKGSVLCIYQDQKGNIWFGGKGAYQFNGTDLFYFSEADGLKASSITGIQEDENGNIFFDGVEGVFKYDGLGLEKLEIDKNLKGQWRLDPNDLWFRNGWNNKGPLRYDGEHLYQLELPYTYQSDSFNLVYPDVSYNPYGIYSIYKDNDGFMWFGTSSLGACRYNGNAIEWIYEDEMTNIPQGGSLGIRSIFEDKESRFWFTNTKWCYDFQKDGYIKNKTQYLKYNRLNGIGAVTKDTIIYPYFMSITGDTIGDLWMVTENVVWQNTGKEMIRHILGDSLTKVQTFTIYCDNDGVLWVGTIDGGVYKFSNGVFAKFKH